MGGRPAKAAKSSTNTRRFRLTIKLGIGGCYEAGKTTLQLALFPPKPEGAFAEYYHSEFERYHGDFRLSKQIGDYNGEEFTVSSTDTNGGERYASGCSCFHNSGYYKQFQSWIFVVDIQASHGIYKDDAVSLSRHHLQEIVNFGNGFPIVIFGNKIDLLLFPRIWEKTKDIYLEFLYGRPISNEMESKKKKKQKKQKNFLPTVSPFVDCPREVVLIILFGFVRLFGPMNLRDRTEEYKALAKEFDIPIMFGSALNRVGINEVLEFILEKQFEHSVKVYQTVDSIHFTEPFR